MDVAGYLEAAQTLAQADALSDVTLMEQLVQREPSALERLYDRYARPVYSVVLRITRQAAAAEEIVQDVFLQLWRNAHRYESSRGHLEPWLFALARNRALDYLRLKSEKQRRLEDPIEVEPQTFAKVDFESTVDLRRRAEKVRGMMEALPAKQRQAIELAFFEGLTHGEIAQSLSEPLGTIKSWIRTGLLRLRKALEGTP